MQGNFGQYRNRNCDSNLGQLVCESWVDNISQGFEMVFFEVQLLIDLIDGLIKKIIWGGDGCAGMMRMLRGFHFNVFEHRAIHDNHLHLTFFLMIVTQQSEFLKMTL